MSLDNSIARIAIPPPRIIDFRTRIESRKFCKNALLLGKSVPFTVNLISTSWRGFMEFVNRSEETKKCNPRDPLAVH